MLKKIKDSLLYDTIWVLVVFLLLRTLVWENCYVPTPSMVPTLLPGDYLITTKYNYGYSRYSIPFFPKIFEGRILDFYKPKRGDVVVFVPEDKTLNPDGARFVKRIIGLPGDKIKVVDDLTYINNRSVEKVYLETEKELEDGQKYIRFKETLPNGKSFTTRYVNRSFVDTYLKSYPEKPLSNVDEVTLKEDEYFVMGDNRDNSADSRLGLRVKYDQIVGKPVFSLFSNSYNLHYRSIFGILSLEFFSSFRSDRFFKKVD